jgi:hypothetical protein
LPPANFRDVLQFSRGDPQGKFNRDAALAKKLRVHAVNVMAHPHTTAIWNRDKSEPDVCQQLDD